MELEKLEELYDLLIQADYELAANDPKRTHFIEARLVVADNILRATGGYSE